MPQTDILFIRHADVMNPDNVFYARLPRFKLSDQGLEYIDEAINVWLDEHPEVDIKLVTSNVGMFDGKFKDLALIVNLWY